MRLHMESILLGIMAQSYEIYYLKRSGTFLHHLCSSNIYSTAVVIGSYLTHDQHTARISDVDVTMCGKRNMKYEPSIILRPHSSRGLRSSSE